MKSFFTVLSVLSFLLIPSVSLSQPSEEDKAERMQARQEKRAQRQEARQEMRKEMKNERQEARQEMN